MGGSYHSGTTGPLGAARTPSAGFLADDFPARFRIALGKPSSCKNTHSSKVASIDCMQLAKGIAGASQVPSGVLDRIVAHADGVPLFLEELTKTVLQTRAISGQTRRHAAECARARNPSGCVDGPPRSSRAVEGGCANWGAYWSQVLLQNAHCAGAKGRGGRCSPSAHLLAVGLIRSDGSPPDAVYTFRHALLQDVAVASLLRSRRVLHIRIALTLESEFPQIALAEPELIAWHYSSAGLVEPAVDWLLSAAKREMQRSGNIEAIDHLRKGLELLNTLPDNPERDRRELDLQTHLGAALTAAKGFAAPEVRDATCVRDRFAST